MCSVAMKKFAKVAPSHYFYQREIDVILTKSVYENHLLKGPDNYFKLQYFYRLKEHQFHFHSCNSERKRFQRC